jgi:hypothetical protein
VQPGAFDADEWTDLTPQRLQLDVTQHLALVVEELPAMHDRANVLDDGTDTETVQDAHGVGLDGDAAANGLPARIAFDYLGVNSSLMQSR